MTVDSVPIICIHLTVPGTIVKTKKNIQNPPTCINSLNSPNTHMSTIIISHFIIYLKEHLVNPGSQGPEPVLLTTIL